MICEMLAVMRVYTRRTCVCVECVRVACGLHRSPSPETNSTHCNLDSSRLPREAHASRNVQCSPRIDACQRGV